MNTELWQRIGDVFDRATNVDPAHLDEWLAGACGEDLELYQEVAVLLANDRIAQQGAVQARVKSAVVSMFAESPPPTIGPYRVLKELGRGGMGVVFLAERENDPKRRRVAVKLTLGGPSSSLSLSWFRRERDVIKRLGHPHIRRLLSSGVDDSGAPYLVLEYVDGQHITEYCWSNDLNVTDRLHLFLQACSALQYAHANYIVHRDVKPGNILVDRVGGVKLLDFGICRTLTSDNSVAGLDLDAIGPPPLSLGYASPEQIRGAPATYRSDVYSLSAVLYELMTGERPPHPNSVGQARRDAMATLGRTFARTAVIGQEPGNALGEIVLCGLEPDPAARYASVAELSTAIRKYLANRRSKTMGGFRGVFQKLRDNATAAASQSCRSLKRPMIICLHGLRLY